MAQTMERQNNSQQAPNRKGTAEYTLYVGAMSCMRHRGEEFYQLQQENKLAYLILDEIDYITGDYLNKIREAAEEVAEEFHPSVLKIAVGCQSALLSTDYAMMKQELEGELSISVVVDENCHLNGFDNHGGHGDHGDRGDRGDYGDRGSYGEQGGYADRIRYSGHGGRGDRGDRGGYGGRGGHSDRGRHREGGGYGGASSDRERREGEGQRRDRRRFDQEGV